MFFRNFLVGISFLFIFSCDNGTAKDPSSYILSASVDERCRSLDYRKVFISYFNQELVAGEQALSEQEEEIDRAFGCIRKVLTQINSEVRGESINSLSKEELKTLLLDPEIQQRFENLGFKNVKVSMEKLTEDKKFDRFIEIKNFIINSIAYFSSGLSSQNVCNSSRERLYKREIEILVVFLENMGHWLKESNLIAEKVYETFIQTGLSQTNAQSPFYFSSVEGKYIVKKNVFSVSDNDDVMKYLFFGLNEGFAESHDLSYFFTKSQDILEQPRSWFRYLSWDYHFSAKESQKTFQKIQVQKFMEAIALIMENNKINESIFLERSDIQLIVMMTSLADILFKVYDKNKDLLVTKAEFQSSTSCLEGFLLPIFKEDREALYHFIEFQEDATKDWMKYYWNNWTGDEDFTLSRGDLSKITAMLISIFFPFDFLKEKITEEEK